MVISTSVISGYGRGKGLGFQTLNMVIPKELSSDHGIYAGWVWIGEQKFMGAFHFGPIPAFQNPEPSLEVFLLDTDIETPPNTVRFELITKLREIRAFDSVEALVQQISIDVEECRKILQ